MHQIKILEGFLTEHELAKQLGRHTRTVANWRQLRIGPRFTMIGRSPHYRADEIKNWLFAGGVAAATERAAAKRRSRAPK
jgi:hypothetical protein